MQNHHPRRREHSPTAGKPPRPPPLHVSIPSNLDPPTRPQPENHSEESSPSPLHSESPVRSDEPEEKPPVGAGAIVAVEKYYSPLASPIAVAPPMDSTTPDGLPPPLPSHHIISFNRREEAPPHTGVVHGGGGERKRRVGFVSTPEKKDGLLNKVALGFRVLEMVFCLISFSVMASDKTQGWSGDSFDRYKEYRYCLAVNVLGFVYAGFQTYNLAYHLATGKHVIAHHLRCQFDFILDQILAYLLMSSSSAAAARVTDWQENWGKDEFTEKVSASVSMSFLAFVAFAVSSLISGYNLCNLNL